MLCYGMTCDGMLWYGIAWHDMLSFVVMVWYGRYVCMICSLLAGADDVREAHTRGPAVRRHLTAQLNLYSDGIAPSAPFPQASSSNWIGPISNIHISESSRKRTPLAHIIISLSLLLLFLSLVVVVVLLLVVVVAAVVVVVVVAVVVVVVVVSLLSLLLLLLVRRHLHDAARLDEGAERAEEQPCNMYVCMCIYIYI